ESIELPAEMPHSYLTEEDGDVVLLLEEKFDYAWHRLELSLERIYLQVEDRDRTAGIYYIGQIKDVEEGTSWFNTVFRDEDEADKYRFRIVMKQDDNTEKVVTRVVIRDEKGKAEKDKIARKVLSKILEGMK
ncbi:MAG: outer membrane protein assembly factor BamC, partial [Gammaproteobacteria bacterium]|nr:outer membrane protein assembly factor BamC [Gammaproteobacteria bacterium]